MQKRPVEKAAEVKAAVKATETKAVVKAEEVKAEAKEVVAKKAETVVKKAEETVKKAEETAKKAETTVKAAAKTTAKKATKKAAAKKTAKAEKKELVPEVFVQFDGNEDVVANVIERAKEAFTADGHRASSIKSLKVYLKPEEYAAKKEAGTLIPYLREVEETYDQKAWTLEDQMMERENVTEELKAKDPMEWLGQVNNIRSRVREILRTEMMHLS